MSVWKQKVGNLNLAEYLKLRVKALPFRTGRILDSRSLFFYWRETPCSESLVTQVTGVIGRPMARSRKF